MARPGLFQHPKFRRLVHALGEPVPHVLGYLECMWSVGYECGDSLLGDETDVELAAQYPGQKGRLFAALRQCRFIDDVGGQFHIHDLYDHAPRYVQRRMQLEAQRRRNGQTISDLRRAAALKRWHKDGDAPDGANGVQTDANGDRLHAFTCKRDANGCNRMQPDATPAPAPAPAPAPIPSIPPEGLFPGGGAGEERESGTGKRKQGDLVREAAHRVVRHYQAAVKPKRTTARGVQNVTRLLNAGHAEAALKNAADGYAAWCAKGQREPQYRHAVGNFYGEAALFEEFLAWAPEKKPEEMTPAEREEYTRRKAEEWQRQPYRAQG
jgi:hypothetical protein